MVNHDTGDGTMMRHNTGPGTAMSRTMSEVESNLGTMVINDEEEDSTMKQYGTAPGQGKYKPDFMEHFDKKDGSNVEKNEEEKVNQEPNNLQATQEEKLVKENLQRQLNQIAGQGAYTGLNAG